MYINIYDAVASKSFIVSNYPMMRLHYYYDHIFMCISFQILEVLGPNSTWTHFQFIHFVAFSPLSLFCLILLTWVVTLISISSLSIFSLILLTNSSKTGTSAYGKSPLSASQPAYLAHQNFNPYSKIVVIIINIRKIP